LPATTVPPTVVALRPERAETVARAQFPQMGIDPGRHQPMQIFPSMHVKSPEAIITDEGEKPSRAQRAAPAAWRPVGRRLPRPLGRASALSGAPIRPSAGPACRARRIGYAASGGPSRAARPPPRPAIPRRRPVGHHRRWRRHLPSGTASPVVADVPAVAPWRIGSPVVLQAGGLPRPVIRQHRQRLQKYGDVAHLPIDNQCRPAGIAEGEAERGEHGGPGVVGYPPGP